ncbi:hypothetical protein THAOC_00131, partial [Thalassiosira oceanica]
MEALLEADRLIEEENVAFDRSRREYIALLNAEKEKIASRFEALDARKRALAEQWGTLNASPEDWVEVNCGGRVISARRGTLCQLEGTNFGAVFSGAYEKKLPRDRDGRIFLDLCPDELQTIVDYLAELSISSPDNLPKLPEEAGCLAHLFGLVPKVMTAAECTTKLREWLEEEGMDGDLTLIYESKDYSSTDFTERVRGVPHTVTVVETECGLKVGGYSSTPWKCRDAGWEESKAFLFALQSKDECFKVRLTGNPRRAIYQEDGPEFGTDLSIGGREVYVQSWSNSEYETRQLGKFSTRDRKPYIIKAMEVYKVVESNDSTKADSPAAVNIKRATSFTPQINLVLNKKRTLLKKALGQVERMESSLEEAIAFVDTLVRSNDWNDIVRLNVCGTVMMTHRSTLRQVKDSVLASQFDDSKWTQQVTSVKTWTAAEVAGWVRDLEGVPDDAAEIFEKNEVTGVELINLGKDELKELGITRPGTVGILSNQINDLRKASEDSATLIEHSPYCFGKILDYLRTKRLHALNLIDEVRCPVADGSQKERFEKVVRYFFPGSQADEILDGESSSSKKRTRGILIAVLTRSHGEEVLPRESSRRTARTLPARRQLGAPQSPFNSGRDSTKAPHMIEHAVPLHASEPAPAAALLGRRRRQSAPSRPHVDVRLLVLHLHAAVHDVVVLPPPPPRVRVHLLPHGPSRVEAEARAEGASVVVPAPPGGRRLGPPPRALDLLLHHAVAVVHVWSAAGEVDVCVREIWMGGIPSHESDDSEPDAKVATLTVVPLPVEGFHPRRRGGRVHLPVERVPLRGTARAPPPNRPVVPHRHLVEPPVVLRPPRVVRKHPVRLPDLLELGRLRLAPPVAVGVERQGDAAVGLLDLGPGRRAGDAEEPVEVPAVLLEAARRHTSLVAPGGRPREGCLLVVRAVPSAVPACAEEPGSLSLRFFVPPLPADAPVNDEGDREGDEHHGQSARCDCARKTGNCPRNAARRQSIKPSLRLLRDRSTATETTCGSAVVSRELPRTLKESWDAPAVWAAGLRKWIGHERTGDRPGRFA